MQVAVKTYAGGAIFGERFGSGDATVVALHGWGRTRADFSAVLDGLDAVSLDLPGFGASPPPPTAVGAAWYASQVAPVFETLGRPPLLLGHSFGGRVGVSLAAQRPDLVSGLILTGVPLLHRANRSGGPPPLGYRLVKLARRFGIVPEARLEAARRKYGSADYAAAHGVMRDVLVTVVNETYENELPSVVQPTRLVWGADDRDVPVEVAERALALLPNATLDVLPDVGHFVPTVAPDALRAAIDAMTP